MTDSIGVRTATPTAPVDALVAARPEVHAGWVDRDPVSARVRTERVLALTAGLFRLSALALLLTSVVSRGAPFPGPRGLALTVLTSAESVLLGTICLRADRLRAWWWACDSVWLAALLFVSGIPGFVSPRGGESVLYSFLIMATIPLGLPRWPLVWPVGCAALCGAANVGTSLMSQPGNYPLWNALPDTLTLLGSGVLSWVIAWLLRESARALDEQRDIVVARAQALARERRRSSIGRALASHIMSTLHVLATAATLDESTRAHVRRDTRWLAATIASGAAAEQAGLLAGIRTLAAEKATGGLRVDLDLPDEDPDLTAERTAALLGAAREALNNVVKHAGTAIAQVRIITGPADVELSIVDSGTGYDTRTVPPSLGVEGSIRRRVREAGGRVSLVSRPGAGTRVRLWAPLSGQVAPPAPDRHYGRLAGRLWRFWAARVSGPDRAVLAAVGAVRAAAAVEVGYGLSATWRYQPHPVWSALLALVLVAESAIVFRRWTRQGRLTAPMLAVDIATGTLAIPIGLWLAGNVHTWGAFVYPYTVLVAFTLGPARQRLVAALLCVLPWLAADAASFALIGHVPLSNAIFATPGYLVNAVVGCLSTRWLRAGAAALEARRTEAVHQAEALAAAQEHAWHARALHDRVLQTMESLARGDAVHGEALRTRVVEQAAWLRHFVETGRSEDDEDLAAGLAAAARAVARTGTEVRLNDASLRRAVAAGDPEVTGLSGPRREALVRAVHQATVLAATTAPAVVVRVVRRDGAVLVSALAEGPVRAADPDDVAELTSQVRWAHGRLDIEPGPYLELWLPTRALLDDGPTADPRQGAQRAG